MPASLVFAPNPVLRTPAKEVAAVDRKTTEIVEQMKKVLVGTKDPVGVGLAAVQIGIPLRIFIIRPSLKSAIETFINPKVAGSSKEVSRDKDTLEGCLSVNNTWAHVKRSKWVELEFTGLDGRQRREKFTGFKAHIIQHEMDHLQGVLFTQRALEQEQDLYRIEKNQKGEEKLVPIEI